MPKYGTMGDKALSLYSLMFHNYVKNVKTLGSARLEIIMPVFFSIILFLNSHILLLLFLHFSAIIIKLCSKKS